MDNAKRSDVGVTLVDTGERMIPPTEGEISIVYARQQFVYQYVSELITGRFVLDIGCGTGQGCKILAGRARWVCGIDYDYDALHYCRHRFAGENIWYTQMNAMSLGFRRAFDSAVSLQVIEHMVNVHDFLQQVKSVVKPGGTIFITTPNVTKTRRAKKTSPFHAVDFDHEELLNLLKSEFSSVNLLGVIYRSENVMRSLVQKLPIYRWGRLLKRGSGLKKLANRALRLTEFRVTDSGLDRAMDLLAICRNE